MDPFIIKLLEEDEDELMHTEAEVEAFTAALYRDIEGGSTSSQPVNPPDTSLSQEKVQTSIQMYSQWQPSSQNENSSNQSHQQSLRNQGQQSSEVEMEHGSSMKIQQDSNGLQEPNGSHLRLRRPVRVDGKGHSVESNSGEFSKPSMPMQPHMPGTSHAQVHEPCRMLNPSNKSHFSSSQRFPNQAVSDPEQTGIPANRRKPIPFESLLPFISSELDKDKVIELYALVRKLKRQEISADAFVPHVTAIVGREILLLAVAKMQAKVQSQIPSQQPHLRPPAGTAAQFSDRSFGQLHQNRHNITTMTQTPASGMQPHTVSHKISDCTMINIQGLSKLQQQNFPLSRSSFPRGSCFTDSNISTPAELANPQSHYPLLRPGQIHRGISSAHEDGSSQFVDVMKTHKIGRQDSFCEPKRMPGVTTDNVSSAIQHTLVPGKVRKEQKIGISPDMGFMKQEPSDSSPQGPTFSDTVLADQGESHMIPASDNLLERHNFGISFTSSLKTATVVTSATVSSHTDTDFQVGYQKMSAMNGIGNDSKALYKNPSNCLQKPLHALASSPPLPSKQQKVAGAFADQSIDHLNDVTAVSGVDLSEEEAHLFSAVKDDSIVTEAFRKAVHEEEDRLLLQKVPLQKKLAEIMTKCGLKNFSNDVERCLSHCVEKRLRGLISSLIRMSKQRVDSEKSRQNTIVTSDVREQILSINREAREEWEQAEAEKLRKQNELDSHVIVDVDKEKDKGRAKSLKMLVNKEEDVQMRTTEANLAARAAVGGDDILSKWKLMAQARQKHEVGPEIAIRSQAGKDATGVAQHGRSQVPVPSPRTSRSISLKDLIAVLEKEPQMAKSTFIYRLYDKIHTDPTAE